MLFQSAGGWLALPLHVVHTKKKSDNFSFGTLRNDVRGVELGIVVVFIVYFFLKAHKYFLV